MKILRRIANILEKLTGKIIISKYPFGHDPVKDILEIFKGYEFQVIFDVGANVGQTARKFAQIFPGSNIFSFEPSLTTYTILEGNVAALKNVRAFNLALGNENKSAYLIHADSSDRHQILKGNDQPEEQDTAPFEVVNMKRLTNFCHQNSIQNINYLKIDTEGFDLDVIYSAEEMLENYSIDFIEVEVGMNSSNNLHVPLEKVKEYLELKDYFLFGVYEQVQEWMIRKPILRRCNVLFISGKLALETETKK